MAGEKKGFFKGKLFKILMVPIILLLILTGVSYIYYRITFQDARKYIPNDYLGLIKIKSISAAYNNLIDLRAAELILAEKEIQKVHKALLEFRSHDISKNKFLTSILDMQVELVLTRDIKPVLIINMGFKSMLLRPFRFVTAFFEKNENFFLETEKSDNGKNTIYKITIHSNQQIFYISIHNNLLFFALDKADINKLYAANELEQNVFGDASFYYLKKQIRGGGIAEIYFNTNEIIKPIRKKSPLVNTLLDRFALDTNSAISMNISNEDLFLSTFSRSNTEDPEIISFFALANPDKLQIVEYLPDNTNIYSAINFHSFKEFYELLLYLQDGQYDQTIAKIDKACQLIFQVGIDDILFSWVGSEIGACTTNISGAPIIFLEIDDKKQFEYILQKLTNSFILTEDQDITYDGVSLNRIKIPDFLKTIIDSFTRNTSLVIDTPYYTRIKNFVFFSMDPVPLANLVNKYNNEQTLVFDKVYRKISGDVENKANIFLYFNMANSIPPFLQSNDMVPKILKLYEKGAMTINFKKSNLVLDLAASGININKTRIYPGFPKELEAKLATDIILTNFAGSRMPEFIYATANRRLFVTDMNNTILEGFPARLDDNPKHNPFLADIDSDGQNEIISFTNNGNIHAIESDGLESEPYPIQTGFRDSLSPVFYKNKLLLYNTSDRKLVYYNGDQQTDFDFDFASPLLSSVSIYRDTFSFYPKSFSGTIYCTNSNGTVNNGWPQDAGGIGYGSPLLTGSMIAFITQSGKLSAWKSNGTLRSGFPVELQGVYYTQPVYGNVNRNGGSEFVLISKTGLISILSDSGETVLQSEAISDSSKLYKIKLFNVDLTTQQEIFVYGGSNNIYAFNDSLELLPGFPVTGNTQPQFYDFNSDGDFEMVVGSIDKKLYIYTIPQ